MDPMCSGHFRHFSGLSLPIILCSVWCTLSADPLVIEWYGVVLIFLMPSSLHIAAITSLVNSVPLVRHQLLGKPKDGKETVVQDSGRGMGRVVIRHKGLDIPGKVVHYH